MKNIPNFENYACDVFGNIYSLRRKLKLKQMTPKNGYKVVTLFNDNGQSQHKVHLIVLRTFVGSRKRGMIARHLDGDKTNNALANLRWGTPKQNCEDRDRHNRTYSGFNHHKAKMTEMKLHEFYKLMRIGLTLSELAKHFGISKSQAHVISKGLNWKQHFIKRTDNGTSRHDQDQNA